MITRLDDMGGSSPKNRRRRILPVWISLVFIGFGFFVIATQTLGLFAGRPWDGYELLFGWDLGSWWWLGRLVMIVGWVWIVFLNVQDLSRKRRGREVARG